VNLCVLCGSGFMVAIHGTSTGARIEVRVHLRARKNAITGELAVSLTAPPIDGKANAACIEFFAKVLKVPRSSVNITSGQSSRQKVIRVSGLCAEEVRKRIG
jgi:uncharacterized protein (TIGR00251 family)